MNLDRLSAPLSASLSAPLSARLRRAPLVLTMIALVAALPSQAQYKVVGPDGKVTYTDRPPAATQGKATPMAATGGTGTVASDANLPLELRQVVGRYPVTLYAVTGPCDLCASARQLLRQRGIPYAEKQIQSPDDTDALERLSGGRDIPTLSIGSQTLRGLAPEVWGSYLDAAGYPRQSRLPATYQYPAATSIVERREASTARPATGAASAADPARAADPAPANPAGIKF
jgi:glutaredoxin